jgi:hypothetical protein
MPRAGVYKEAGFVFDQDQVATGRAPRGSRAASPEEDHLKVRLT